MSLQLDIPVSPYVIKPGDRIRIERFDVVIWEVMYGWYSWANNRPVCGWYLKNCANALEIKPLFATDLHDIYMVESTPCGPGPIPNPILCPPPYPPENV